MFEQFNVDDEIYMESFTSFGGRTIVKASAVIIAKTMDDGYIDVKFTSGPYRGKKLTNIMVANITRLTKLHKALL